MKSHRGMPRPPDHVVPRPHTEMVGSSARRRGSLWFMKAVDHWVGLPLCFALGLLVRLRHRLWPRPERPVRERGTLVVLKFFGIGTILEATSLLAGIRRRYPQARLAFITFQSNESLLRRLDLCTDVRVIRTGSPFHFVLDTVGNVLWMRARDVDAVVDLEFFSKFSTLMAVLGGAHRRVGYHLNAFWRSSLLTHPVYFNYYRHVTDVFAQAGSRIDVAVEERSLHPIPVDEAARRSAEQSLQSAGWTGVGRVIGVNVNAGDLSLERRWPVENFVSLIETLLARHADLAVVLTGAAGEAGYVRALHARLGEAARARTLVAAGLWSLDEFIAALEHMECFITNDSGPLHIAAAQGVPLVSLWGPSRPDSWAPHAARHEMIYEDYPCSPCIHMFTTHEGMWCRHEGWCMQAITVARVLGAVDRSLARPRTPAGIRVAIPRAATAAARMATDPA
jgi:ADP-heptose:LPS heptosyltransferase